MIRRYNTQDCFCLASGGKCNGSDYFLVCFLSGSPFFFSIFFSCKKYALHLVREMLSG